MPARAPVAPQPAALSGAAHTSGIYSDMTVDGIEIGTLVVVVDRARHLPNLRTMGKQDPYCAARLGKEAKKTDTDRRGGQTPRWDQELRFTVRDGADYNRLKVSVFNDDKKTDLIGETWVMLDSLLLPGGGQGDSWHNLTCKGRYAGEIRVELTFYDTRPKDIRPRQTRSKQPAAEETKRTTTTVGPRELPAPKRRPLPAPSAQQQQARAASEPVTSSAVPLGPVQPRTQSSHPRRLSEQPVHEAPEEEEVWELEPDVYTQRPSALASYASTKTNPYHASNGDQDQSFPRHNGQHAHLTHGQNAYDHDQQSYHEFDPEDENDSHTHYPYQQPTAADHAHHSLPELPLHSAQGAYQHSTEAHGEYSDSTFHQNPVEDARRHTVQYAHAYESDAPDQYLVHPHQQYAQEHVHYSAEVPGQRRSSHGPQFAPLHLDREHAPLNAAPRPLPPVALPHSNSAPEAIHYGSMQVGAYAADERASSIQPAAYSSPAYEPQHNNDFAPQAPVALQSAPPRHDVAAYSTPNPMHAQQPLQSHRPLPVHASSAPGTLHMADDMDSQYHGGHAPRQTQPVHHTTYPGLQQPQGHYAQQRTAAYAPQYQHSIPDFSRNYDASMASTAPLRHPQPQQMQTPNRPVSMVEPITAPLYSPQPVQAAAIQSNPRHHVARKSISSNPAQTSAGYHFSPDSFDTYNTHSSRPSAINTPDTSSREVREPSPMYAVAMPSAESSLDAPDPETRTTPDGRILTKSGKVVDPSDHIPSTSWAPEPEPKASKRPTVAVHIKNRFGPRDARTVPMPASATGTAPSSVSLSPLAGASMRPRHSVPAGPTIPLPLPQSNSHPGRNVLQKRNPSNPLAESAPGTINSSYRTPTNTQAPPIPPKLPLGYANGEFAPANEPLNDALSQEMSLIDIGPSENRSRRRGLFGRSKKRDDDYY